MIHNIKYDTHSLEILTSLISIFVICNYIICLLDLFVFFFLNVPSNLMLNNVN